MRGNGGLNYCRSMKIQFGKSIESGGTPLPGVLRHFINLADKSEKFLLPINGKVIDDSEFRGLRGAELNLPFPCIALEFRKDGETPEGMERSSKSIVFARQIDDTIVVSLCLYGDREKTWAPFPEAAIKRNDWIDENGRLTLHLSNRNLAFAVSDYEYEVHCLIHFLNVLACSNVRSERLARLKNGSVKSSHQFDSYYVLTVGNEREKKFQGHQSSAHRSPREHLRRGHIRRLDDGRRIWVNSTVVAANKSGGRVTKDYALTA